MQAQQIQSSPKPFFSRPSISRNARGFSTPEFIMVIVIVVMAAAFAIPRVDPLVDSVNIQAAARDLVSELQLARMRAIAQNARIRVDFTGTQGKYQVQKEDSGGWTAIGPARALPQGIQFTQAADLVFEPTGAAPGASSINISDNKGKSKSITVTLAGKAKIAGS